MACHARRQWGAGCHGFCGERSRFLGVCGYTERGRQAAINDCLGALCPHTGGNGDRQRARTQAHNRPHIRYLTKQTPSQTEAHVAISPHKLSHSPHPSRARACTSPTAPNPACVHIPPSTSPPSPSPRAHWHPQPEKPQTLSHTPSRVTLAPSRERPAGVRGRAHSGPGAGALSAAVHLWERPGARTSRPTPEGGGGTQAAPTYPTLNPLCGYTERGRQGARTAHVREG